MLGEEIMEPILQYFRCLVALLHPEPGTHYPAKSSTNVEPRRVIDDVRSTICGAVKSASVIFHTERRRDPSDFGFVVSASLVL